MDDCQHQNQSTAQWLRRQARSFALEVSHKQRTCPLAWTPASVLPLHCMRSVSRLSCLIWHKTRSSNLCTVGTLLLCPCCSWNPLHHIHTPLAASWGIRLAVHTVQCSAEHLFQLAGTGQECERKHRHCNAPESGAIISNHCFVVVTSPLSTRGIYCC